jgi:hypothetical protein
LTPFCSLLRTRKLAKQSTLLPAFANKRSAKKLFGRQQKINLKKKLRISFKVACLKNEKIQKSTPKEILAKPAGNLLERG